MRNLFTSEAVFPGHPDKVCDQIADAILDECLAQDPKSRVAVEVLVTTNYVTIAGEVTTQAKVDYEAIAREKIRAIGYTWQEIRFCWDTAKVVDLIHTQSPDISQGVDRDGAGDNGLMFGGACEGPEFMPVSLMMCQSLIQKFHSLAGNVSWARPDGKVQVTVELDKDGNTVDVDSVVFNVQHEDKIDIEGLRTWISENVVVQVVKEYTEAGWLKNRKEKGNFDGIAVYINPTGRFVVGGPDGDAGVTNRKIICDTYGGWFRHGGGGFSGKDPTKVDRSGAYYCRYVAKNIVAAGLAKKCEVQVGYAIGVAKPMSIHVDTFGTGIFLDRYVEDMLYAGTIFDFRPVEIIKQLGLRNPDGWTYQETASHGHFGHANFPWERTDKVEALKKLFEIGN